MTITVQAYRIPIVEFIWHIYAVAFMFGIAYDIGINSHESVQEEAAYH